MISPENVQPGSASECVEFDRMRNCINLGNIISLTQRQQAVQILNNYQRLMSRDLVQLRSAGAQ